MDIRVLIKRDGDWWVVRGLDKDIAAQAHAIGDAIYEFERILMTHVHLDIEQGREPLADIPAAPPEYVEMWQRGLTATHQPQAFTTDNAVLPSVNFEMRVA